MKHYLALTLLLVASICANAQTNSSIVIRKGNTYITDNKAMNKKEFKNYLQEQNSNVYPDFQKALKLSNQGWAIFGAGLGAGVVGFAAIGIIVSKVTPPTSFPYAMAAYYTAGTAMGCLTIAGITCLGVGYGRMHQCVDVYNVEQQQKNQVQLQMNYTGNGVGLAVTW